MSTPAHPGILLRSQKIYERLLAAYPKSYRAEFGPAMAQLFRDQSRDAWREAQGWGIARLWLRVLPDLIKTSIVERFSAFNQRKTMFDKIAALFRPYQVPGHTFRAVFVGVFVLALGISVVVSFILPESYAGTARIRVDRVPLNTTPGRRPDSPGTYDPYFLQTEFEVIQSAAVLGRVVEQLNLTVDWGKKYNGGPKISTADATEFLRQRISLRPVRNTQLVSITAYAEDPREAARLANAIADAYQGYCRDLLKKAAEEKSTLLNTQVTAMEVLDAAEPERVPARPNKSANIALGALVGVFLGAVMGGASAGIVSLIRRNSQRRASLP